MSKEKIAIVGGGLVGSLLSIFLAQKEMEVTVYERRPDSRKVDQVGGRSINLALSNRGWAALKQVGIAEQIKALSIPMEGRIIHATTGETVFQAYGKEGEAIYSVSREGLNQALDSFSMTMDNVNYQYSTRCDGADRRTGELHLTNELTGHSFTEKPDYIFGTDGAFSKIRAGMQRRKRFDYSQDFLQHGYKELCIPAADNGGWRIDKNALHIWPRESFMLIALPNLDGSFTCTLFLAFEGKESFEQLTTPEKVQAFFEKEFPDVLPHMPDLQNDFFDNPTDSLVTIRCFPWSYNQFLLLGDSSHAIVPFYGQGMNSGFEDCNVFNRILEKHQTEKGTDWAACFSEFEKERKPDADAIAELALRNFVEMRDSVGDPFFLLRKKIEKKLMAMFPDDFIPTYSLVTFTENVRYSDALKRADVQNQLFADFMQRDNLMEEWDSPEMDATYEAFIRTYKNLI